MIKAIGFDFFNTVFDASGVPKKEIHDYLKRCTYRPWVPLDLPASWEDMPPFPDAKEGIARLAKKFMVVPCTNAPYPLQAELVGKHGLAFHKPNFFEDDRIYKPDPAAYLTVARVCEVLASEVMIVTANPTFGPFPFGDVEMAELLGMEGWLIRNIGCPETIIELAEELGC